MQRLKILTAFFVACCPAFYGLPATAASAPRETEKYVPEPTPPGFQVVNTELEGNVFADASGRTLYIWPQKALLAAGTAGDGPGKSACSDVPTRETLGAYGAYPATGTLLPAADKRPTCVQHWPPVYAPAQAKPVGNWTLIERTDGRKQWAYKGQALYTSHLDSRRGETWGGTIRYVRNGYGTGAPRRPATPEPFLPPQFKIAPMAQGRMLVTLENMSIYTFDKDTPTRSNCRDACVEEWTPIVAAATVIPQGEWSTILRTDGTKQWTFRGRPLYTHKTDSKLRSYEGGDVPGWRNVFTQRAPALPKGFQVVDTFGGQVLADSASKTIYWYNCQEDTPDTLICDSPDSPQEYRWAVCGGGDPVRCLRTFPYVVADRNAKSESLAWSTLHIDPMTGRKVEPGAPNSLHVWAYRGRPIYTFVADRDVGDINADGWGEVQGMRNGFTAFFWRDHYEDMDGSRGDS